MKKYSLIVAILVIALALTGCRREEEIRPTAPTAPAITQPITTPNAPNGTESMPQSNIPDPSVNDNSTESSLTTTEPTTARSNRSDTHRQGIQKRSLSQ